MSVKKELHLFSLYGDSHFDKVTVLHAKGNDIATTASETHERAFCITFACICSIYFYIYRKVSLAMYKVASLTATKERQGIYDVR